MPNGITQSAFGRFPADAHDAADFFQRETRFLMQQKCFPLFCRQIIQRHAQPRCIGVKLRLFIGLQRVLVRLQFGISGPVLVLRATYQAPVNFAMGR
jgi:hypothetical protein